MNAVFLVDAIRTPIGRYAGALATIRTDDLAALPLRALLTRQPQLEPGLIDEVVFGCANQSGEDNRNVARMASLLAGLPVSVPAITVNRLCASGLDAIIHGARAIACGDADIIVAGGVESMSRSPFVMAKPSAAFGRDQKLEDSTLGWRFINPKMAAQYGVDTMTETAENLAREQQISREDQDAYALRSQQRTAVAQTEQRFAGEILPVEVDGKLISTDEHPRSDTTLAKLASLKPLLRNGSVTAGNASGLNDGAGAMLLMSERALNRHGLTPRARLLASASAGVAPRTMGIGPVPAINKLLQRLRLSVQDFAHIEINEAFAAQVLACSRALGLADDAHQLNPDGGAIALGHPLGLSGLRLVQHAMLSLQQRQQPRALCALCVGVGQGVAMAIERV
ncbi:3-oxoadipyl-CoA thiolase [Permianibacter sp. IMCC34836]|uniref:3-oxoadipyl-CoA thiolase n=1 Tax=Permianibacter fluminis TaxID=2738515 RepID=UPI001555FC33|nr:3-oxoadipyl-CoA thiolase [Permianibacter fluminis]NQD36354.1 3-oxoadipyl-CoA thiolase [Permianibacter fluminis]